MHSTACRTRQRGQIWTKIEAAAQAAGVLTAAAPAAALATAASAFAAAAAAFVAAAMAALATCINQDS